MEALLLRTTCFETALGTWRLAAGARGLCWLELDADREARRLAAHAARRFGDARIVADDAGLAAERAALESAARGGALELRTALDPGGTDFQREVWAALRAIPRGATRTYGELARELGRPGAARAVGLAAGANPLPVIVPCHRLVAAAGLGGFSGGIATKRALLELEGHARAPVLDFG
jgi:methylated-DNA-[protein]-cysteine S-methyltransferase